MNIIIFLLTCILFLFMSYLKIKGYVYMSDSHVWLSSLEDLLPYLPSSGARLMGLDIGKKTIGLSMGDTLTKVASPLFTVKRKKLKDDAGEILKQINEWNIIGLVAGYPLNMDGSEGPRCQSTKDFLKVLMPHLPIPVVLWDERLSTSAVERTLIALDVSRQKRGDVIDAHAAAFILQGVLDRLRFLM